MVLMVQKGARRPAQSARLLDACRKVSGGSFITGGRCSVQGGNARTWKKPRRGGFTAWRSFVRVDHIKLVLRPQLQPVVQELLDVEAVLLVTVRRVLEIGVLRQVVLVRQKRPHAPELEDALAAVQHRQLVHAGKLMARPLVVHAVGLLAALAHPGVEHIYGLLAQGGGKLLQGGRLTAAQEDAGVHVADDGVGVVLVDRL